MTKAELIDFLKDYKGDTELKFTLETKDSGINSFPLNLECVTTCQSHNYINFYFNKEVQS